MKTTEGDSKYSDLSKMSILDLLNSINSEDKTIAVAVEKSISQIESLVSGIVSRMKDGGRLFYVGAGTSGRLGIVDASECPPTFGVSSDLVLGIIAGGDIAIRYSQECAEDDVSACFNELKLNGVSSKDIVIGIAASGSTPYVLSGLKSAKGIGVLTGCVVCNEKSPIALAVDFPVEVIVGPEFITGSTRMKSGTAQKMVLNMISTSVMIKLGHIQGNKMVDMKLSCEKLIERGSKIISEEKEISKEDTRKILLEKGSVRSVLDA